VPERDSYEPGTPSWVDLATTDVDGARRFYGELLGWEAQEAGPAELTGGYAFFMLGGRRVAGVGPLQGEPGRPPAWSVYVSTDDVDALAQRARAAGAEVLVEPMDVMAAGRMAVLGHPAAGTIGAWQPGEHRGAEVVNDPGSFNWCELHTRDPAAAKPALSAIFGWEARDEDFGGMTYTALLLGGSGVAGMVQLPPDAPAPVPSYWVTYFAVDDCDASVARVRELGGNVLLEPVDAEGVGRFAMVGDPQGAMFGVIAVAPAAGDSG
jgi:uncharacterized protein